MKFLQPFGVYSSPLEVNPCRSLPCEAIPLKRDRSFAGGDYFSPSLTKFSYPQDSEGAKPIHRTAIASEIADSVSTALRRMLVRMGMRLYH